MATQFTELTQKSIEFTRSERKPSPRSGRCVQCGRPRDQHSEAGACPDGLSQYATMSLPEGITCGDCVHVPRCCCIFGQLPEDEICQFFPIRFRRIR